MININLNKIMYTNKKITIFKFASALTYYLFSLNLNKKI